MKKKVHPKDQTKELSRAKWEFLTRNPKAKKEYEELEMIRSFREWHEKALKKEAELLKTYPEMKAAYDKLEILPMGECDELLKDSMCLPSVIEGGTYISWFKVLRRLGGKPYDYQELNLLWKEQILKDAKTLLDELIPTNMPDETLIVSIDLTRPTETILAEINEILSKNKARLAKERPEKHRLKWLSVVDELLEVWDIYDRAGQQPWQKTFRQISRKVKRPLSTVKDQWKKAYKKINGKPYEPESKYTTEEKSGDADEFCSKCPHDAVCYKKSGEWIPCQDYLRIAGKGKNSQLIEYRDDILYDDNMKNRKKQKYSE